MRRPILVVVGDKARARIFDTQTEDRSLREIEDLVNAGLGRHERDTRRDRPGRGTSSVRGGGRTALGDDYARRRVRAARFAETVAEHVRELTRKSLYSRVFVVAGPEFLGLLRPCLTSRRMQPPLSRVTKDLTRHSVEDIRKHLPEHLK
jgi:protein required for attachment to host cells